MAQEGFNTFLGGVPFATLPLAGTEGFCILQGSVTSLISYNNVVASIFPSWSAFSTAVSASSGTLTSTGTVGCRYLHGGGLTGSSPSIGKFIAIELTASITNVGTGSGAITFTLPFAAKQGVSGDVPGIVGREPVTGKSLNAFYISATQIGVTFYDGTFPGANGRTIALAGIYECA